ncbi:uncharacterized protein ACA1_112600 [Acanthamoeba castellanii str. Neff]|uniref:Uncharacterized protein n=1 Tax=Acanthamoeba castellanii (strain ATCC 30010 / Neff) TaxID=1257118 RepID=L8H663_ACACF|nr:uncharacterized protein ACA1_112600 [Acanthamoeba castellanii str. Neff]ELR19966.1 hypothetical protein ACA1_112600 [Acanthamoeba castellanii str. Neff]
MASKVNKWEQKIADANPKPDYKVGEEKKTWKTNGHSGGGHTAHDGKYKAATVKTPTTFDKPPPPKKSLTDLP